MNQPKWSKSNIGYGRKLLNSGLERARSGREAFLNGESRSPFLAESARNALKPAAFGLCIGVLGGYRGNRHSSADRVFAHGFIGVAIGFATSLAWESRRLAASVASGALRNIGKVRDEHWLERHPIDYAQKQRRFRQRSAIRALTVPMVTKAGNSKSERA
jgi:hypothetical protein